MRQLPDDWRPQGIGDLEDRAWTALRETKQSVSVTAGAGAGKTEFLAQKAAYLLETGICPAPKRILAISFKRDAARNLSERLELRCPDHSHRFVSLTFDAFTKSLMDQFRSAIDERYRPDYNYRIVFPKKYDYESFLARHNIRHMNAKEFEKKVANTRLPLDRPNLDATDRAALEKYWDEQLHGFEQPFVSFLMINRMVEWLIREHAQVRKALQATYPVVFLDEFQDTTLAQYQALWAAFYGSSAVLTAVGDDKQRIMGWAGAMKNSFKRFGEHFKAVPVNLLSNWRSHSDLVAIQHLIASRIDADAEEVVARRNRQVDGDIAAIWEFESREEEIDEVGNWISSEIENEALQPQRIAILVRNYADAVEQEFAGPLGAKGVRLRNVARQVGEIAIQDLLAEEFTEALLPFLRLGAERTNPSAWDAAEKQMQLLYEYDPGDDNGNQRLMRQLEEALKVVRTFMGANPPNSVASTALVDAVVSALGESDIRQTTPTYSRAFDYDRVKTGFTLLLEECRLEGGTWSDVLDRFEGKGQVPLMTVHKSKGLEFHTVIFFGLDDRSWWSLKPNEDEELNSFFVALTRAEQRAFFTSCGERGGPIVWLEDILGDTVPRQKPN